MAPETTEPGLFFFTNNWTRCVHDHFLLVFTANKVCNKRDKCFADSAAAAAAAVLARVERSSGEGVKGCEAAVVACWFFVRQFWGP